MQDLSFSDQLDTYVVLKLSLSDYTHAPETPGRGFRIADFETRTEILKQEMSMLKANFPNWAIPFYGRLKGWREDSPIYLLKHGFLVGGLYICDKNEFNEDPKWGQLHYFFIDPKFRGKGYHRLLFSNGVAKAKSWGLNGVYINTDRYGLPEVYQRWGAVLWKKIARPSNVPKPSNRGPQNWLVYSIHDKALLRSLKQYASGVLVDIGCGDKSYTALTKGLVSKHIGIDHDDTQHDQRNIDVFASAYDTTLPDKSADTVLCTSVLEHLERPQDAIREMYRILRPKGYLILSAPLIWHLHEEPRDFFRYTKYGLKFLFEEAGFQIIEIRPLSGFVVTFAQELVYFLDRFKGNRLRIPISPFQFVLQRVANILNRYDDSWHFTWQYILIAQRK